MNNVILIKYGELTTKKDNRNLFINKIYENLSLALSNYDITITKNRVRMFIDPKDNDIDEIISITKNIFGIHSIVVAYKIDSSIDIINSSVLEVIKEIDFNTFKVETDRADKSFPINSMDLSRQLGSLILKNTKDKKVDVHNPDYLLKIIGKVIAVLLHKLNVPDEEVYDITDQITRRQFSMMFDNFQAYDVQETRRVSREEGRIEGERVGRIEGERAGRIEGEQLLLIKLVIKKLEKNYSAEQIAEILEESLDTIQPIYDIALRQAPDYNTDKVFEELNSNE